MKKVILIAIFAVVAIVSKAQTNFDEIALMQSVYGMEKKELITKHMTIEPSKTDLFWQMYDEYEVERKDIGVKRADNIIEYTAKYETMTGEDANSLMIKSLDVQSDFIKLWEKTYRKMAKSISPVTAAQFIQAEMFLENLVRQELAFEIPMIGEFDIKK